MAEKRRRTTTVVSIPLALHARLRKVCRANGWLIGPLVSRTIEAEVVKLEDDIKLKAVAKK